MNYKILAIFLIILLSSGYASALTFDVNATGNNTQITTSSTWTALRGTPHNNLTITTGTTAPNQTIIISSFDSMVNYTTTAFQVRLMMDDSATLNTYNITQLANVKSSNSFVSNVLNISGGTHNFTLQAWSTAGRQAIIYRWNMTVQYIEAGNYTLIGNASYVKTDNTTYLKNTSILNTSTVTVTKNANGTIELTSSSSSSGGFTFQNKSFNNGSSRTTGVIYQNLNTTTRFVSISIRTEAVNTEVDVQVASITPPPDRVCYIGANLAGVYTSCSFLVLPDYYYGVYLKSGTMSISDWSEWN